MNSEKSLAVDKNKTSLWMWVGPCASALCLVHCFGFAILAIAAPSLLELFPHSHELEFVVLGLSLVFGAAALWRLPSKTWHRVTFAALAGASSYGLAEHSHTLFHLGLVGLACLQLWLMASTHFFKRKAPACCDHGPSSNA